MSFWFDTTAGAPSAVAYFDTGGAWVAAGAPLAADDELGDVAARFVAEAARHGRRTCFFGTERRFSADPRFAATVIGEQPVWDPRAWPRNVAASRTLRSQLSRARRKDVVVRELSADELVSPRWSRALTELKDAWLASRGLAPMAFLVQVELFTAHAERRTFIALQDDRLVACLAAVPVYGRQGWLFEDILRVPGTPNGTTELLIDAAMTEVAASGARHVTLGLAPLSGPVPRWLGFVRRELRVLYDFQGVRDFRAKLGPARWDPIELSFVSGSRLSRFVALYDSLLAFAAGDFVGFGLRTLFRHPRLVAATLVAGLLPWMALLAWVPWPSLFPSAGARAAWLAFDAVMSLALGSLALRFRPWLARLAEAGAWLDASLGSAELIGMALRHQVPRSPLLATLSLATPCLAAACLHVARHRAPTLPPSRA